MPSEFFGGLDLGVAAIGEWMAEPISILSPILSIIAGLTVGAWALWGIRQAVGGVVSRGLGGGVVGGGEGGGGGLGIRDSVQHVNELEKGGLYERLHAQAVAQRQRAELEGLAGRMVDGGGVRSLVGAGYEAPDGDAFGEGGDYPEIDLYVDEESGALYRYTQESGAEEVA